MEQKKEIELVTSPIHTDSKPVWKTPVLTRLDVEDAESGNNVSENGATGS